MYPMKMIPAFKDYLWGGQRLLTEYHKQADLEPLAESWEVSCHADGLSRVANGEYAGRTLREVLDLHPEFMGPGYAGAHEFPILVKLIDAADNLSLQVHPDDAYAKRVEGQPGKNEMWYILDAEPGATLILGCQTPLTQKELRSSIEKGNISKFMNKIPVQAGDCYQIPAGMLHAIGAGILLAEVQQSSNVTYRVYDYDRVGADGKPRPLHIDKAVEVIDTNLQGTRPAATKPLIEAPGFTKEPLTDWAYFQADLVELNGTAEPTGNPDSFCALLVLKGELLIRSAREEAMIKAGESVFLPAGMGGCIWQGKARVLMVQGGLPFEVKLPLKLCRKSK